MFLEILRRLVNFLFYRTRRLAVHDLNDRLLRDIGYEPRNHPTARDHWTDHYL